MQPAELINLFTVAAKIIYIFVETDKCGQNNPYKFTPFDLNFGNKKRRNRRKKLLPQASKQTWNWVIGSAGQWVIWVIFHVRVTGSSF